MKTVVIPDAEFERIIARDESHFFDIKSSAANGRTLQKVAVAFSNADGGELIVGVKDKKCGLKLDDRWEGVSDIERLNGHLQALFEVKPALDIQYQFMRREAKSGYALRVLIEKGTQLCTTSDGSVYLRQGAQSLLVKDLERIQQLNFAKGAISFEDSLLVDYGGYRRPLLGPHERALRRLVEAKPDITLARGPGGVAGAHRHPRRSLDMKRCQPRQRRRLRATSGRSCSTALSDFF